MFDFLKSKNQTLFRQMLTVSLLPVLLLLFGLYIYSIRDRLADARKHQLELTQGIAEQIAAVSELAMISRDPTQLNAILSSALTEDILAISVSDAKMGFISMVKNASLAQHRHNQASSVIIQNTTPIIDPITGQKIDDPSEGNILGQVTVLRSVEKYHQHRNRVVWFSLWIGTAGAVLSVVLAWLAARKLTRPLVEMKQITSTISRGESAKRLQVPVSGELLELQNHINEMAENIEQKRAELEHNVEQLKKANKLAEQANRAKTLFLANISHELRTPMNGSLGMMQLLENTPLNKQQQEYLQHAKNSSQHLMELVNDVLDFSRIENGEFKLNKHFFNLGDLFNSLLPTLDMEARKKGLEVIADVDQLLLRKDILSDPTRIRQILINLINNAIKFTDRGEIRMGLHAELINERNLKVRVDIEDTGSGIDRAEQQKIFEYFHQTNRDEDKLNPGFGLGLAIVKALCEALNIEITLSSRSGQGSCFTLTWIATYQDTVDLSGEPTREGVNSSISLIGRSALVVEDNPINQLLTANALKNWGMTVFTADDGDKALKILQHQPVDIILMDMRMPVLDGLATTCEIRKTDGNTPIIALTANNLADEKCQCLETGMNDFLSKPISLLKLKETMAKYLINTKATH